MLTKLFLSAGPQVGGNSGNVLGVCRLLSSLAGGPMFWISGAISKRIGVNGVLTWSFTSYVLRFIIYASIKNPWQVGTGVRVRVGVRERVGIGVLCGLQFALVCYCLGEHSLTIRNDALK